VAHGVDPAVKAMEAPDAAAIGDGIVIEPGSQQLRNRDDPVLRPGHPGDQNVGCGELLGTSAMN
jgi:hypothetical protein